MKTEAPLVSVIVPVRNGERFIAAALASIVAQDYAPLEIIVVDGHSTDRTGEIIKSSFAVQLLSQTEPGLPAAYNQGIAAAHGAWIAFLESDDIWTRHKLRVQMDYMERHPHLLYTMTKARLFLEPGCAYPKSYKPEWLETPQSGAILSTFLARREVFAVVGKFNPSFTTAGDMDWFARAKDSGVPMEFLPEVLLEKRIHDENLTHQQAQLNHQEMLAALRASIHRQRQASVPPRA